MWQDQVIAAAQLAFVPAMLPTLKGQDKPALSTSAFNAVIVGTIATAQGTLGLWFAVATSSVIAAVWLILAMQQHHITRHRARSRVGTARGTPLR